MADPRAYMAPDEFAALPAGVHHAVWRADAEHRIDAVPASAAPRGSTMLYRRDQVQAIADGLEVAG